MASQRFLGSCWRSQLTTAASRKSYLAPRYPLGSTSFTYILQGTRNGASVARKSYSTTAEPAPHPQSPPPRSLLRRIAIFAAITTGSTLLGFAMATAPAVSTVQDMMSPPTDVETLNMYTPLDERSAEINKTLVNHPIAQALRGNQEFVESRPYFKIPEAARARMLTGGILSGPGLIWVPPLAFAEGEGKSMTVLYYLGNSLGGYPGVVHGGLQATLLDEVLARCSFGALPNKVSMTANLNINYKAPMPTNSYVVCRAELERVEGRKAWVKGRLESLPMYGEEPIVFVEATGLFIEPKQAAALKKLYPAAVSAS